MFPIKMIMWPLKMPQYNMIHVIVFLVSVLFNYIFSSSLEPSLTSGILKHTIFTLFFFINCIPHFSLTVSHK